MYNKNTNVLSAIIQSPISPRSTNVLWDDMVSNTLKVYRKGRWTVIGGAGGGGGGEGSPLYWGYDAVTDALFPLEGKKVQINNTLTVNGDIRARKLNVEELTIDGENFNQYWELDPSTNTLYTNYQVKIGNNLIVEGDTSSGGNGQDTPAADGSLSNLSDVSLGSLSEGDVLVYDKDNGVWYNVSQSKIVPNLEGYAKQTWVTENFLKSDTLDAYKEELGKEVKGIADLLNSMWRIEGDNLVTDKQVLIKNNLIVEQDTSSGGEGQDTPAEGTVTGIEVNGTPYEPNTQGVIDLSDAFKAIDVSDQLKDYAKLTDITKSRIDSVLGSTTAGNANRFLMSTGSTSVWASISDYALPLSGGKMTGTITVGDYTAFGQTGGNFYLGTPAYPLLLRSNGTTTINGNTLIHSGNIGSQSVAEAKRLLSPYSYPSNVITNTTTADSLFSESYSFSAMQEDHPLFGYATIWNFSAYLKFGATQLAAHYNALTPRLALRNYNQNRANWSEWREFAFLDDNVASATKLQTARTIWGQSFNGTGNVSGHLSLGTYAIKGQQGSAFEAPSYVAIGYATSAAGYATYIDGYNIYLRSNTTHNEGLILNSSGNVTIGGSDLAGTSAKLYVDNGMVTIVRANSATQYYGDNATFKICTANPSGASVVLGLSAHTSEYCTIQSTKIGTGAMPLSINPSGGNVLIGTTTDSGYKLDVNGDISAMSALRIGGCGTSYCGLYPNNQITSSGDSSKLWLYNESGLVLFGTTLEIYPTTILYDKLGIGISSPTCELDVVGGIKATKPIFGYMYGTNNNAAAFIFDKPGSNHTGIGSDGVSDTIRFGACDINGTWVSYNQKWKFYGDVKADKYRLNENNSSFIGTQIGYLSLNSAGNEMCIGANGYNDIHINYRASADGTVPKTYYWRAGTATSWADHYVGTLLAMRQVETYGLYLRDADTAYTQLNMFGLYVWDNVVQFTRRDLNNTYQKSLLELNLNNDNAYIYGNLVVSGDVASA